VSEALSAGSLPGSWPLFLVETLPRSRPQINDHLFVLQSHLVRLQKDHESDMVNRLCELHWLKPNGEPKSELAELIATYPTSPPEKDCLNRFCTCPFKFEEAPTLTIDQCQHPDDSLVHTTLYEDNPNFYVHLPMFRPSLTMVNFNSVKRNFRNLLV